MPPKRIEVDDRQLALISKALADPMRFHILQKLADATEAPTCSCVRDCTGLAPATVSHHLKELDGAGLATGLHMQSTAHTREVAAVGVTYGSIGANEGARVSHEVHDGSTGA